MNFKPGGTEFFFVFGIQAHMLSTLVGYSVGIFMTLIGHPKYAQFHQSLYNPA